MTRDDIHALIYREGERQDAKWAGTHPWGSGSCASTDVLPIVKAAVLTEECGKVARAVLDGDHPGLAGELVQVAAVAIAWLESLPLSASNEET